MNITQETLYAVALTRINHFNLTTSLELYRKLGSATAVMEHRHDIKAVLPDATPRLEEALKDVSEAMRRAEQEMKFDEDHNIQPLVIGDDNYPERLRRCDDAPLVLYYRGTANLNHRHIISIVGTRHCTIYGQDIIRRFTADMKSVCHDTIIISGLAYGVDINAHRQALTNGMETVGVLAHGLDYLYPTAHRETATEMLRQGGLATEFMTGTNADKMNFVRRNRIVAGLADATIVVESASKGGSLITANLASDYNRDVFAFPGNVGAPYCMGTNNLIRDNKATLITSAEDFVNLMGWANDNQLLKAKKNGIERQLFPELNDNEKKIASLLANNNNMQISVISMRSGLTIPTISAALLNMEMQGIVRQMAGGIYHLIE